MRAKVHKEYTSIVYNHIRNSDMKGSIQMKKHYILLSVVITTLIFVLFGGVGVWYTYETATTIMNNGWPSVINRQAFLMTDPSRDTSVIYPDSELRHLMYFDFQYNSGLNDVGYYEMYICDDGKKIESCNFIKVEVSSRISEERTQRYIPVGSDFQPNLHYERVNVDAMCDDNFIFNGTISGTDYSSDVQFEYTIGENELACTEDAISTSELGDDFYFEATYYPVAETKYGKKLCDEAKKKLEDTLAATKDDSWFKEYSNSNDNYYYHRSTDEDEFPSFSYSNGVYDLENVVVHAQKDIITSFYISHAAINSDTDNIYVIYLFHPLELALRANVKIYVISLLMLIALETLVIFFIRKMYIKSKGYEIMRQDLTRSIAHDLKTPLAITKAYVENWEYIDEADRHEYAEKLNSEVDHMTYIINTMLNMSNFDLKKNIKLEEVNIYSMAMAIYERMKPIISERELDVRIYTDNEDGDYYVYADPKMMRIVINNFITNAVKYAQSSINMDFYIHEKTILFVIGNDGTTISKKDIKKIWEPFYKADKTRTDRIGSSGMGLAINKSILKLHNAKFKCTSNAGRTTFSFEMKKVGNNGE